MAIIDLSHPLSATMPVYPGSAPPEIRAAFTVERDGFAEQWIGLFTHTGTHIDAPAHMLAGAPTLDRLPVGQFFGPARVVDVAALPGPEISLALLEARQADLEGAEFVLFHTGWSGKWGQEAYFTGFPVLAPEAARWLCGRGLKGLGFDAISIDIKLPEASTSAETSLSAEVVVAATFLCSAAGRGCRGSKAATG